MHTAFNAHELLKALSQKAEEQGLKSRFEAKFQSLKDSIAVTMANSCSELCQSASYGDGTIIGTSPFCGGDCSEDCTVGHCYIGSLAWADYGNGCWSGNKVCCCGEE